MKAFLSHEAQRDLVLLRHPVALSMADVRAIKAQEAEQETRLGLAQIDDPAAVEHEISWRVRPRQGFTMTPSTALKNILAEALTSFLATEVL